MAQSLPILYNATGERSSQTHAQSDRHASAPRRQRAQVRPSRLSRTSSASAAAVIDPKPRYYRLASGLFGRAIGTYLAHRDMDQTASTISTTA